MKSIISALAWSALAFAAEAALTLGSPFSDGMVIQRGKPMRVFGKAGAGAAVRVEFAGKSAETKADAKGAWRAELPPMEASRESRALVVTSGSERREVKDVVVGEVWLCSGQSNMEMAIADWTPRYGDGIGHMVAQVTRKPLVRYIDLRTPRAGWHALTPEFLQTGRKAALAVHFALELYAQLEIPIGVAVAAVGGSNIDSWNPSEGAKAGYHSGYVKPFAPNAVRGAIWYQGETNVREGSLYTKKLHQLYDGWSAAFEDKDFSFYYVQIAPYAYGNVTNRDECVPEFFVAQEQFAREEPRAAMAVINDIGDVKDIHPKNKWLVAKRLALHALKRDYGYADVEDCSPTCAGATAETNVVTVTFAHATKLYVHNAERTLNAPFELAGADGKWKPAKILNCAKGNWSAYGTIDEPCVKLAAAGVAKPTKVRYAWRIPWTGVVYNQVDLPLGTFAADVK